MQHSEPRFIRRQQPVLQSLFTELPESSPRRRFALPRGASKLPAESRELREVLAFVSEFFADFRSTASLVPSSPDLAREMVQPALRAKARVVVEFGPGTGPMTAQLLDGMSSDGKILSFEINPKFVQYLKENYPDPRLQVVEMGAEHAADALNAAGLTHADAVISSLPLSFFPPALREAVLRAASSVLRPGGVFTQFQYASGLDCSGKIPKPYDLRPLLGRHFTHTSRAMVWRNFPPCWVYRCTKSVAD